MLIFAMCLPYSCVFSGCCFASVFKFTFLSDYLGHLHCSLCVRTCRRTPYHFIHLCVRLLYKVIITGIYYYYYIDYDVFQTER